ncbi:MAG TPA: lipoate--protein ligase family protein [Bacteroidota bacterium]|nr:lipoate--protein ligase family protein [Bacteroidota bacterium]
MVIDPLVPLPSDHLPPVRLVEYPSRDAAEQLALDEALLDLRETQGGPGLLRFWESGSICVVLGHTNSASREVNLARARARGVPILRRMSGGGAVVQGPGCLNFSLILEIASDGRLATPGDANAFIMRRHAALFDSLTKEPVAYSGFSDLTIHARKFSGNAQRRRLRALLFHGCVLLDFDLAQIDDLLPMPSREPAYRDHRAHGEFVRNLGLPSSTVTEALRQTWGAHEVTREIPHEETARLLGERYRSPAWTFKL